MQWLFTEFLVANKGMAKLMLFTPVTMIIIIFF